MENLTIKDLQVGYDFWIWASEHPRMDKEGWPRYGELIVYYDECPFCESYHRKCRGCPLSLKGMECRRNIDNPFEIWEDKKISSDEKITQAALTIAAVFKEEIEKIEGGGRNAKS